MRLAVLEALLAARQAGKSAALLTVLDTGAQFLFGEVDTPDGDPPLSLRADEQAEVERVIREDRSQLIERAEGDAIFVDVWNPAPRLYIVGGVRIAQALVPMSAMLGYKVVLIDPRSRFATAERFPAVEIKHVWPDEALADAKLDKRSAVVALTHDPKIDDPALIQALQSPAFYIGALGSRRTHAARIERLVLAGFDKDRCARVRGPVGLAIGAITPAEIAVSILAEMTAALRRA